MTSYDDIEGLVTHEFGHHVHNTLYANAPGEGLPSHVGVGGMITSDAPELTPILDKHLPGTGSVVERAAKATDSVYAGTSPMESFAEMFNRGMQPKYADSLSPFVQDVQRGVAARAGLPTGALPELPHSKPPAIGINVPPPKLKTEPISTIGTPKVKSTVVNNAGKASGGAFEDVIGKATKRVEGAAAKIESKTAKAGMEWGLEHSGKVKAGLAGAALVIGGVFLAKHHSEEKGQAQVQGEVASQAQAYSQPLPAGSLGDQNRARKMQQMSQQRAGSFLNSGTSSARHGLGMRSSSF